MKLKTHNLESGANQFRHLSGKEGWLRAILQRVAKQGFQIEGELESEISITKLDPDYYIRGQLAFEVEQPCARCAEPFRTPMGHRYERAFSRVSTLKDKKVDISQESDEADITYFEGNEIDLSAIVEEQIFLSLPYQALCKIDCKGICQKCGKNLNMGSCACENETQVSPFAVLRKLKD